MTRVPPGPTSDKLNGFWERPASELLQIEIDPIEEVESERHRIFCLLLMAMVRDHWNGNIWGADGKYPWRHKQLGASGQYTGGTYLGHNIAAIAVSSSGDVIDFDFNHNDLFQSTIEHAESRLVRRLFDLTEIRRAWLPGSAATVPAPRRSDDYMWLLGDVTIYTSLESCAQCAGIMTLASAKTVVYLQSDPGQYCIGNVLYNLAKPRPESRYHAPKPVPADLVGVSHFEALNRAHVQFRQDVRTTPFFDDGRGRVDHSGSISSFLCTDIAMDIFTAGSQEFEALQTANVRPENGTVLGNAKLFRDYVRTYGCRGTPH